VNYYRYFFNGNFITVTAESPSEALKIVRAEKSARFARECMLTAAWPDKTVPKAV
jgi:hypothetical protein